MKVPYELTAAVAVDERNAQMLRAIQVANERGWPRLEQQTVADSFARLSIACYGPSLLETWQDLQHPILSMSGATKFLADHGVIADYHVDMDPRLATAQHIAPAVDGVHYILASVCHPDVWEIVKHQRVTLWHTYSGVDSEGLDTYGFVAKHDRPGALVLRGGSTIGLTALHLGGVLGYRHFEIFGMDGNYSGDPSSPATIRHAGVHHGNKQKRPKTWNAEGRTYHTNEIMANAVAETINTITRFPIFCVFHGDGLTQALVREANVPNACTASQVEKAKIVRGGFVRTVDMPPLSPHNGQSFWDALVDALPPTVLPELLMILQRAEPLRKLAAFNTGSIPLESALLLRALCDYYKPKVIAEIGTFIGVSTYALQATKALYTCDKDNDCVIADPTRHIRVHPKQSSTQMFQRMLEDGLEGQVDLFFFDGRIQPADLELIQRLGHARSLFVFDDCSTTKGADKGLANIQALTPILPDHLIAKPSPTYDGRSTLGALLPLYEAAVVAA